ncbi:hypothetical protein EDC18_10981 [Natranaerovirga pectinivora]|uniref:Uncharacterized protein n=2 Tax=Natranaerovirga pectinivora TaxID=682400 RepID=A0A4R3MK94_9FIRM|nr:hypothetical protein EDC18_10981 [Natranaerovirga pectinivora]
MKFKGITIFIICLSIISIYRVGAYRLVREATFYIEDIQGDSSVLDDVIISGLIRDEKYGQYFEIGNNKTKNSLIPYESLWTDERIDAFWYREKMSENTYVPRFSLFRGEDIDYEKTIMAYSTSSTLLYNTGVRYDIHLAGYKHKNIYTIIDNSFYFTVPTGPGFMGENGIYRIDDFSYSQGYYYNHLEAKGKVSRIVTIDLDKEENKGINIWGITNVENKLVLITSIDDAFTITAYEPETGEVVVEETFIVNTHNNHQLNIFVQENLMHLEFFTELRNKVDRVYITIELKDDITIKNNTHFKDHYMDLCTGETRFIYYVQDKCFIFAKMYSEEYFSEFSMFDQYSIFVFDNDVLLYQGAFITDIEEDMIADRLRGVPTIDYTNNQRKYQYRNIKEIVVRPRR